MKHFLIDPYLITLPPPESTNTDAREWLMALDTWLEEIDAALFEWHHSRECTVTIQEKGLLPDFSSIRKLINKFGLDFNASIITRRLSQFLLDSHCISERLTTKAALYDNTTIAPPELISRAPTANTELEHTLVCISCDAVQGREPASELACITLSLQENASHLAVSSLIAECDPNAGLTNQTISHDIPLIYSPHDLFDINDCATIINHAAAGYRAAISSVLAKNYRQFKHLPIEVGPRFWASVEASDIHRNPSAFGKSIRIAAAIAAEQAHDLNVDLRHLRESAAADAKQVERSTDKAKAWRVTITTKGIGWRMHYWLVPPQAPGEDSSIVIANILKKGDAEVIPD